MTISATFNQPFQEMLAAFRLRLQRLVPTQRWDDLSRDQHQRAFAVAGAQKANLLADLAASVDTAIAQGKSTQWFAKNFDSIVAQHGWSPRGGNDWRARVIYDTNISTSYAAGRLSQLQAGNYKFWIYKHSHLALDHARSIWRSMAWSSPAPIPSGSSATHRVALAASAGWSGCATQTLPNS